jgi:hypothetical protein
MNIKITNIFLGHFHNYPYGAVSRAPTGFASSASLRGLTDASTGNSSQNTTSNELYDALTFAQDPMLGMLYD